jgi:FG-GAP-like repeat
VSWIAQEPFIGTFVPFVQVEVLAMAKSPELAPVIATVWMLKAAVPVLRNVTLCAALVVPRAWVAKATPFAERLNDGKANFTLAHTYQIPVPVPGNFGGEVVITGALDLNGDGKIDLVGYVVDASGWSVIVLLGNGDGSFGSPITTPGGQLQRGTFASLAVGDLNGDGKPDVMIIAGTAAGFSSFNVLLGNGDGTFGAPVSAYAPGAVGPVLPGDFNKDGKLDVIVGTNNGIAVLLGNGDGTFQPTTFITNSACGANCNNLAAADFNGDGNADLIVTTPAGYQVLIGKGDGTFSALPAVGDTFGAFEIAQIADFNGDGKMDVLGGFSSSLGVILGNGDGTFTSPFPLAVLGSTLVADFNGDGQPDIAVLSSTQLVWLFNTSAPGFAVSASTLSEPTVVAGGSSSATITVSRQGGFNGNVTLSCSGLTDGVSCGFAPASIAGGAGSSTLTISTTAETPPNTYAVNVLGTSGTVTSQQVVMLTVTAPTAPDFSVTPGSGGTATVAAGKTATYMLSLGGNGGFSGNVALSCSGAPATTTCGVSPATVSVGGATPATATVTTTARSEVPSPVGNDSLRQFPGRPTMLLASLVAMLIVAWTCITRKNQPLRCAPVLTIVLALVLGITLTSCGGGSSGGGGGTVVTGTQAGTYTITVSATAPAGSTMLTHTTKLTLIVQ